MGSSLDQLLAKAKEDEKLSFFQSSLKVMLGDPVRLLSKRWKK